LETFTNIYSNSLALQPVHNDIPTKEYFSHYQMVGVYATCQERDSHLSPVLRSRCIHVNNR